MSRISRGGAALALLSLLAQPTAAQNRRPDPVTVAVRIAPADAGPYVLTTAPGVRAVTPAAGQARPGDLPLTFFLSPSIPAGRTRIATLALPRSSVPVWYSVPERSELGLSGPSDAVVTHGRNLLSVTATNRGNVDARVRVRAHSPTLQVRVDSDSARVPAGATTLIALHVIVPGSAQPGTTYEVRVSLATNGEEQSAATTMRVRVGSARARLPVELGVLREGNGDPPLLWVSADGWIVDSVRLRGTFASRGPWWYGSLAPRGRSLRVSAPGWRFEAGEIDLARPSDVSPWLGGTGLRAEIGRARGWSLAGGWIRMPLTGAAAAQLSAGLHGPGLTLDAALLGVASPGVRSLFPTLALSAGGSRARGGLSGGALLTGGGGAAPVGSGNAQVSIGGLRVAATASRTAQPADATAELTLSTVATAAVDLPTGAGTSLFATGVGSRAERDSAGEERQLSSSTSVRAGARYRASHLAVIPAIELRTLSREGRPAVTARTAGVAASSTLGGSASVRVDAGWTRLSSADSSFGSRRLSAGFEWRAAPGFLILAAGYGDAGTLAASRAPALHAQLVAGLRSTPAAADLDLLLERQRGGTPVVHGTATASLHVGWQSDVLLAVRRAPPLAADPAWSVALGLRSSLLGIPVPRGDRRPVLFEDLNANGRRDSGERGLPGVPLSGAHGWASVTDAAGRFTAPAAGTAEPDLSSLGEGWRVTAVTPRAIAAVRLGSLAVRVVFRDLDPSAVERTPRGAAVLVSPRGEATPAPLDSTGAARWSDLSPGTYRAYHLAPGAALPAATPADAAQLAITAGDEAGAVLLASYQPRRILVRRLGAGSDPLLVAAAPEPAPPPAPSTPRTPRENDARAGCGPERGTGTVRPSMTETEVACSLGSPARVSRRGAWSYWFYRRRPGAGGAVYDDVVFFRDALVVTAVVREPGRRYDGPPPHGRIVEELRAGH